MIELTRRDLVEIIRSYARGDERPDYWTLLSTATLAAIELEQRLDDEDET